MGATQDLAELTTIASRRTIPPSLLLLTKCCVLDAIACGVTGRALPWSRAVAELAGRRGGRAEATALGRVSRLPAAAAAWVNGVLVGADELDHGAHQAHPGSTVLPAALAAAEARSSSGAELLVALTVGYEIACRVGAAGTRSVEDDRHFHNPGANGPFGAAAAAARLLGLDTDATASALGIAGSSAAGLTEYLADGSMTKRLHLGAAARGGLEAAELAESGVTGPRTVLEGGRGYLAAFAERSAPARLTDGLGEEWLTADVRFKRFPCHVTLQGVVAALTRLRGRPTSSREVRAVSVVLGPGERLSQTRFHVRSPSTLVEAQYSLPTCVAAALARDLGRPGGFSPDILADPEVDRLAAATTWTSSPDTGIRLVVDRIGGERIVLDVDPEPPAVTWDGTVERFGMQLDAVVRAGAIAEVVALVEALEDVPDAGGLLRLVNGGLVDTGPDDLRT